MWLRLNDKEDRSRIINLDKVTEIYLDDETVEIKFEGSKQHISFTKQTSPDEYNTLHSYFSTHQLEALVVDL